MVVTTTLFRPVGQAELDLIEATDMRRFPPRLPEQAIFYPVCNEEYAIQIATRWNTQGGKIGYVTRFEVRADFLAAYDVRVVGSKGHYTRVMLAVSDRRGIPLIRSPSFLEGGTDMAKLTKGPQFLRFALPLIETLREIGNSGRAVEVTDRVIERLKISEAEQAETTSNGQSRVRNQIAWARFYLVKAGLLDSSRHGVWSLTKDGRGAKLDANAIYSLFKDVQAGFSRNRQPVERAVDNDAADEADPTGAGDDGYATELLGILRSLPPAGFERICQRLLRESGFERVEVTGRSGDGGIDGEGVLAVNPLVTFKVLFQCKRYKDGRQVTTSQVRDFRGAMAGRADKGIIITTGSFTSDARKEATRDGVPPIELVDQVKLVMMFENARLGLQPKQTFEVDAAVFEEFRE